MSKVRSERFLRCQENKRKYPREVTSHPLYLIWRSMRNRCYVKLDTNYPHYGDRGIKVAKVWAHDPARFIKDCIKLGWKKGLWIERIDNDGHYIPKNVKFNTASENCHNRRMRVDNLSGYVGVIQRKDGRSSGSRYRARYVYKGKMVNCGSHGSPEAAARARDIAILEAGLSHIIPLQLETI